MSGDLAPQDVIRLARADQMALLSVLMAEKELSYKNIRFARINGEYFLCMIENVCSE